MNKKSVLSVVMVLLIAMFMSACGAQPASAPDDPPAEAVESEESPAQEEEAAAPAESAEEAPAAEKPMIKLAENPWSGSQVNVAVAKILLEEEMGYPVEVVAIDENAQWPALASGDLHASLEVWPSGHTENVQQYIEEQSLVKNAGPLGPVGEIGWFMPTYVLDEHPELATWEGFQNPELAASFATAETGDKGQFLAGDPSWVQYDADIIKNLDLSLEVVTAGSEEAILAALDSATSREESVLFYFWTPHSAHAQFDLTQVELPSYSEECYADAESGSVDCAYPSDELFKIVWGDLESEAPEVYQFISNLNYSTQDQIEMIADVELEEMSAEEAARGWIAANEDVWQAWLP